MESVPTADPSDSQEWPLEVPPQMDEKIMDRGQWSNKLEFVLSVAGGIVGLGNVWRFPYLCYKNGGVPQDRRWRPQMLGIPRRVGQQLLTFLLPPTKTGAFLIPYFIFLFICGIPLFVLETSLGQFTSEGAVTSWRKICPLFEGIGYATQVIIALMFLYYIIILAWAIFYLSFSFSWDLPWCSCNNTWNTGAELCGSPPGIEQMGELNWDLALCLLAAWVVCYFCIWKGVKSSGKVVYFTATFPYVMLTVLLIRGVTLPGASQGIKFYLYPDLGRLTDPQVWMDAGTQIFFSLLICQGCLTALGSYNKYNNNCYRDSLALCFLNCGTSFIAGFAIFSILGFMSYELNVPISQVAQSGPGLAFIVYPRAVSMMPFPPLWACCFFIMIILLGLDSQFMCVESVITAVVDMYPSIFRQKNRRELLILAVAVVSYLIGLVMLTEGTFAFSIIKYSPLKYNNVYVYPWWGYVLGWFLALSSMGCVPLWIIYRICTTKGTLREATDPVLHRPPNAQFGVPVRPHASPCVVAGFGEMESVPRADPSDRPEWPLEVPPQVDEKIMDRGQWSNKLEFVLSVAGGIVGLGNVWRFPYLCYKNGGGAFLIPYFIFLFICGIPLFFLESALGQFTSEGAVTSWRKICPLFEGIGYGTQVITAFISFYYIIVLAWAIFYLSFSFYWDFPWSSCNNTWNTKTCVDFQRRNYTGNYTHHENETSPVIEFWERRALRISPGIEQMGELNWDLALCLLAAWVMCYFCICKGVKSSGKVVYFTATFPYVMLTVLLIRGVTLPGASQGIKFYLYPDLGRLADPQVWIDAGTQIFFSLFICQGCLTALGSYNKYNNNCYRDSLALCFLNCGTSFIAGFAIFSILGFMSYEQNVPISQVAKSGPGLAFIVYPRAVSMMPFPPLWACCFFILIILLGLDSQFVSVESLITAVVDMYPSIFRQKNRRELLILAVAVVSYLIGLVMLTEGGIYVFQLFDYYAASGMCLLFLGFFETVCIAWIYGADRFFDNIEDMIGYRPTHLIKFCWLYFTPVTCFGTFAFSIIKYSPLKYNNVYVYPWWGYVFGWFLALSSMGCVPLWIIYRICTTKGTLRERILHLTKPSIDLPKTKKEKDKLLANDGHQQGTPTKDSHLQVSMEEFYH
ncbi:hypothetical protein SKAU_G00035430 [Synaphobranchus kaupii]|uniref:Transporter n=1 Tax=Synaphobranchus kaupii TaxID=118154 RepID=A0A9Q1GG13_SYNKA|nr:hypothetical protein SKAU_G00035430 [Synaphobranchus kaupii]